MLAKKDICLSRCLFLRLDLAAYLHAVPLAQTHQYSRCLGPGRLAAGGEGGGRGAGEKTGIHTPCHGLPGVGAHLCQVGEPGQVGLSLGVIAHVLGKPIEDRRQLLPGDRVIGTKVPVAVAAHDALAGRPANRLAVPGGGVHIRKVHWGLPRRAVHQPPQDGHDLGPGRHAVGRERVRRCPHHETIFIGISHRVEIPRVRRNIHERQAGDFLVPEGNRDRHLACGLGEGIRSVPLVRDLDWIAVAVRDGDAVHLVPLVGLGGDGHGVALVGAGRGHGGVAAGGVCHSGRIGGAGGAAGGHCGPVGINGGVLGKHGIGCDLLAAGGRSEPAIKRVVAFYNQDANDEKNEVAQKTAEFIEERIGIINHELGTAESELADFKQRSGLTDLTSDARLALQESSKYEQQRTENATQISLVQFLRTYINDPVNKEEVIPANVGLQDQNLTRVIEQYNTMIIERKRLLRTSSENNPAVINMNTGVEAMRRNVETTVNSVLRGLQIAQKDIERQASKFESRISDAPKQEKEFMTISRQQEIKATLYIMLLQKREENAITLAATANNGRIVEEPLPGKDPVAPKKLVFLLAAFVVGLFIPVGIIFVVELLKYKIENRGDVEQLTNVPILGELPLCGHKSSDKGAIVVRENKNDMMEETFRGLRTNLLFMLRKDQKVILFSSTQPGEGKSFVTGNLAVSLAYLGKKVVVVGMDIRKPGLNKVFDLSKRQEGISNYLMDPEDKDLFDLVQPSGISPNLDILLGGTIPPNPTELVARDTLEKAIEQLKSRYDYVLLDTAPIGMVTDTAIISRVADMCVYVCRADVTPKAAFCYINVLRDEHKFDKLAVVINGIDLSKRKNTYGYGYGKKYGYGYGKHYGYGYGYGYGFEAENKKKK